MDLNDMTVKELKALAEEKGAELPSDAKKAELVEILTAALADEAEAATEKGTPADEAETETEHDSTGKIVRKAYVGPAIPGGLLTTGKILCGTEEATNEYLAPVLNKYPEAKQLIVPLKELEKGMREVKNPKKLLYHTAQKLSQKIKMGG